MLFKVLIYDLARLRASLRIFLKYQTSNSFLWRIYLFVRIFSSFLLYSKILTWTSYFFSFFINDLFACTHRSRWMMGCVRLCRRICGPKLGREKVKRSASHVLSNRSRLREGECCFRHEVSAKDDASALFCVYHVPNIFIFFYHLRTPIISIHYSCIYYFSFL